jgi:hypothetical protein
MFRNCATIKFNSKFSNGLKFGAIAIHFICSLNFFVFSLSIAFMLHSIGKEREIGTAAAEL